MGKTPDLVNLAFTSWAAYHFTQKHLYKHVRLFSLRALNSFTRALKHGRGRKHRVTNPAHTTERGRFVKTLFLYLYHPSHKRASGYLKNDKKWIILDKLRIIATMMAPNVEIKVRPTRSSSRVELVKRMKEFRKTDRASGYVHVLSAAESRLARLGYSAEAPF
ncbi:hypothetical protein M8818_000122 [Zalaria obscura]|uniref:Uncharacterized protein n=1 Tax=Zalaria obscura TaxID=2024903 RepID=A0ACC3SRZ9_9PEZI